MPASSDGGPAALGIGIAIIVGSRMVVAVIVPRIAFLVAAAIAVLLAATLGVRRCSLVAATVVSPGAVPVAFSIASIEDDDF